MGGPLHLFTTTVGKKVAMALSGIVWVGYVVGHLIGNLQIFAGPEKINAYAEYLPNIPAFPDAIAFLDRCRSLGAQVVLSSSAKPSELDRYLELLDANRLGLRWTNSDDVSKTKPHPDLIHQALEQVPGADALMIGDATWDVIAASRAGISTLGLLTGGYGEDELRSAGALDVYANLEELTAALPNWLESLGPVRDASVAE